MGAVWTVVVAAGRGERFGAAKQLEMLGDAPVVDRSVATARAASGEEGDGVVLVLADDLIGSDAVARAAAAADAVVAGGATRSESVRAGLAAVPGDAEVVVVHDAARPLATVELFRAVVAAVRAGAEAAVPAVPVRDTVKRVLRAGQVGQVAQARVRETVARDDLVAVQTPQAFTAACLRAAHAQHGDASDDAALVEAAGGTVVVVEGDPRNLKITTPDDLLVARALLEEEALP